jgi:hypothetical protein
MGGSRRLSLRQASPPAGPVGAEGRDHAQHRRGVPASQHQSALPVVPRSGHERSAWITRTSHCGIRSKHGTDGEGGGEQKGKVRFKEWWSDARPTSEGRNGGALVIDSPRASESFPPMGHPTLLLPSGRWYAETSEQPVDLGALRSPPCGVSTFMIATLGGCAEPVPDRSSSETQYA